MELISLLQERFSQHPERHPSYSWQQIVEKISPAILQSLSYLEETGGEIDVLEGVVEGKLIYVDCSERTPIGRTGYCYDEEALQKRKQYPPLSSAIKEPFVHGATLLKEEEYYRLQEKVSMDSKTSSWIFTPDEIRQQGGALFVQKRYGRVFTFVNGAESYYKDRAFRAYVVIDEEK